MLNFFYEIYFQKMSYLKNLQNTMLSHIIIQTMKPISVLNSNVMLLLVLGLLLKGINSESQDKFVYSANDTLSIEPSSSLELTLGLITAADDYLSEANIELTMQITQNQPVTAYFNIIYFNYQTFEGQQCYSEWVSGVSISVQEPCQPLNNTNINTTQDCVTYMGCSGETIRYKMILNQEIINQIYIVLQNNNTNQILILNTLMKMELVSENMWFYWGVGLTCLLLISLVIFTGIVFYWSLKYKKVKKMFEQFKLTQEAKND